MAVCCALKGGAWPKNLWRIVLPEVLRNDVLKMAHQDHIGGAAMKRIMREYFWWPGMSSDVESFVKN